MPEMCTDGLVLAGHLPNMLEADITPCCDRGVCHVPSENSGVCLRWHCLVQTASSQNCKALTSL